MLIVCPSCASEYTLDPDRIGERSRKVRCAACRTTWMVSRSGSETAEIASTAPPRLLSAAGADASRPTIEALPHNPPPPTSNGGGPGTDAQGTGRGREFLAIAAILVVVVGGPAALVLREQLVRQVPASGSLFALAGFPVNLVGLELAELSAGIGEENGVRVLLVEGEIRSAANRNVAVPRLEFEIESKAHDRLYQWSVKAPVSELGSGESARFTARLASPPPTGERLVVSFQPPRGDQAVALR